MLGYFGARERGTQRKYQEYVEAAIGMEVKNRLGALFASTFLGSRAFIDQVMETAKILKSGQTRVYACSKVINAEAPSGGDSEDGGGCHGRRGPGLPGSHPPPRPRLCHATLPKW